jgi:hypothetical protein
MKPVQYLLAVCLLVSLPTFASAEINGNTLLQKCAPIEKLYDDPASLSSKEASGVVYCLGYIDSFMDTFYFQVRAKIVPSVPFCIPEEELPKKEIVTIVVDYLEKHPEELDKPAGYHIFMALREAYPCNREKDEAEAETTENNTSVGQ